MTLNDYAKMHVSLVAAGKFLQASRLCTKNPTARDMHSRALDAIKSIIATLDAVIAAHMAFDAAKNPEDSAARAEDLMWATMAFDIAPFWIAPIHLGDHIVIDQETNQFKIEPYGRWLPLNDNLPITVNIPLPELDRLFDILDTLHEQTGIEITAKDIQFVPIGRDR